MRIEFDSIKNDKNIKERGISFETAAQFDIETALIKIDNRKDYKEIRYNALGLVDDRLYHMTYTIRADVMRIISLRKANKREVKHYAHSH